MRLGVGATLDASLPLGRLAEHERAELARLVGVREELQGQLSTIEAKVQLLLLNARDRRGLAGRVSVDLSTGVITKEESQNG